MTREATDFLPAPGEQRSLAPVPLPNVDISQLLASQSLAYRCARYLGPDQEKPGILIDGDRFDPKAFPYLLEIYDETHPDTVVQKAAQLGATACFVLKLIDRLRSGVYPRSAIYGFPTQEEASQFSQARFSRIVSENAGFFAGLIQEQDSTQLKRVGPAMLYFLGINMPSQADKRATKLLSKPADGLYLDEYDDMDESAVATVMTRLDSSRVRELMRFGHPTHPERGIAVLHENSDQRRWLIKCQGCNEYTCLEDDFPSCIGRVGADGPWFRCCRKCKREIFVIHGKWVAKFPDRKERRGYLMSQLLSTIKPLSSISEPLGIVEQYDKVCRTGKGEAEFWNFVMARPFASLDDSLGKDFARTLFDPDHPVMNQFYGPSYLGADVGANDIFVQIAHHPSQGRDRGHWRGTLSTFDELLDLGKRHNVQCGVIDKMAETRAVTDFTKRASWAWGARYVEDAKSDPIWVGEEREVRIGRTSSLDDSHRAMVNREFMFARMDEYAEMVMLPQLVNLARVTVTNARTRKLGEVRHAWHVQGTKNDHHRHAVNYCRVAGQTVGVARAPDPREGRWREATPLSWMAA